MTRELFGDDYEQTLLRETGARIDHERRGVVFPNGVFVHLDQMKLIIKLIGDDPAPAPPPTD